MIEERQEQETTSEKETGRLEAFSDGVFAVAITILVFDLKVPPAATTSAQLLGLLGHAWASYLLLFISFATILIMWISHHSMFKLIHRSDTLFMFANGFLLLLVTIVPFANSLVANYLETDAAVTACAFYAGLFLVINITYILLWWSAVSHHLLKANVSRILVKTRTRTYLLGLPGYLLALLCAFWNPFVSVGICSVLWLFWAVASYEREPLLFVHTQATKGTTQ